MSELDWNPDARSRRRRRDRVVTALSLAAAFAAMCISAGILDALWR